MADYSFFMGLWKSIKNTVIILAPAAGAGWLAFQAEAPVEYQPFIMALGGFIVYMFKNYIQVKRE